MARIFLGFRAESAILRIRPSHMLSFRLHAGFILSFAALFSGCSAPRPVAAEGLPKLPEETTVPRSREANEYGIGKNRFHGFMEFARLRAVTLVHEDVKIALGLESGRQRLFHFLDESLNVSLRIAIALTTELVDERADEPRR